MTEEITDLQSIEESQGGELSLINKEKLSQQEKYVLNILGGYEYVDDLGNVHKGDPESLLKSMFEDSTRIITQNSKGDIIPDYKARAMMKVKLLESMGVIKQKQPEVRISFLNVLFGKN